MCLWLGNLLRSRVLLVLLGWCLYYDGSVTQKFDTIRRISNSLVFTQKRATSSNSISQPAHNRPVSFSNTSIKGNNPTICYLPLALCSCTATPTLPLVFDCPAFSPLSHLHTLVPAILNPTISQVCSSSCRTKSLRKVSSIPSPLTSPAASL